MTKRNMFLGMLALVLTFGLALGGCSNSSNSNVNNMPTLTTRTLTGYSQTSAGSRSAVASPHTSRSANNGIFNSNEYRSFPINNPSGEPVTFRNVTVEAILQFEREVPGYNDNPNDFVGYLTNYLSYPSDAQVTGNEKVILVFDSREPSIRYQVGYHQMNMDPSNSNLEFFEDLIGQGKPVSIFHVDAATMPDKPVSCWVIQWISESEGGIAGSTSYFDEN